MIPEKATRLLMELSIYNEVEKELAKQNKLNNTPDNYTASEVVMRISWYATSRGVSYWERIYDILKEMEPSDDVPPIF